MFKFVTGDTKLFNEAVSAAEAIYNLIKAYRLAKVIW
jgi:hypothetical protein